MTTTTSATTLDLGQEIARDYWKVTAHVFSRGYPDTTNCALCGVIEIDEYGMQGAHIVAVYETKPTVTAVVSKQTISSQSYEIELSCKHNLHTSGAKKDLPTVGAVYDCFSCHFDWLEQTQPGLPESIKEQIEALIPKCLECMQPVERIPFVKQTVHTIYFDMDGQTGQLDGESDHDDTLDEYPDWQRNAWAILDDGWYTGEIEVECKNKHSFRTKALAYRYSNGTHDWKIVKAVS